MPKVNLPVLEKYLRLCPSLRAPVESDGKNACMSCAHYEGDAEVDHCKKYDLYHDWDMPESENFTGFVCDDFLHYSKAQEAEHGTPEQPDSKVIFSAVCTVTEPEPVSQDCIQPEVCATCRYFYQSKYLQSEGYKEGECRRHAPSLVTGQQRVTDSGFNVDAYNVATASTQFPSTRVDSWCGDYVKKSDG